MHIQQEALPIVVRYYLLGGDIAAPPSGLYARLCHAFLVFICLYIRHGQKLAHIVEYLQIYWTDFRNLFTI